jgi:DNA-binding IclR family transcriptional regulator
LEPLTSRTRNVEKAHGELERIRRMGWALSRGEYRDGLSCVAAPIFGLDGEVVAAMSVAGPDERVIPDLHDLAELVVCAARDVSHEAGFRGSVEFELAAG